VPLSFQVFDCGTKVLVPSLAYEILESAGGFGFRREIGTEQ